MRSRLPIREDAVSRTLHAEHRFPGSLGRQPNFGTVHQACNNHAATGSGSRSGGCSGARGLAALGLHRVPTQPDYLSSNCKVLICIATELAAACRRGPAVGRPARQPTGGAALPDAADAAHEHGSRGWVRLGGHVAAAAAAAACMFGRSPLWQLVWIKIVALGMLHALPFLLLPARRCGGHGGGARHAQAQDTALLCAVHDLR